MLTGLKLTIILFKINARDIPVSLEQHEKT